MPAADAEAIGERTHRGRSGSFRHFIVDSWIVGPATLADGVGGKGRTEPSDFAGAALAVPIAAHRANSAITQFRGKTLITFFLLGRLRSSGFYFSGYVIFVAPILPLKANGA